MKVFTKSVAFLAAMVAAPAFSASDGTLGPTSSGTFTVSLAISPDSADDVQVYGLEDFSFSGTEGGTINGQSKGFCMIRSPSGGTVNLTISSFDSADTGFQMKTPGGANQVSMLLFVDKLGIGPQQVALTEGTPSELEVWGACTKGSNFDDYILTISPVSTEIAPPGNYSGSFLVTVAPN